MKAPDLTRARRRVERWFRDVPRRLRGVPQQLRKVRQLPELLRRVPPFVRGIPARVRALTARQRIYAGLGLAAVIGLITGLIVFVGGGDEPAGMSREQFVAEFKRVTDDAPADDLLGCIYDKTNKDQTLQKEALKPQASPDAAAKLEQMVIDCRVGGTGRSTTLPSQPKSTIRLDDNGIPLPPTPNNSPETTR